MLEEEIRSEQLRVLTGHFRSLFINFVISTVKSKIFSKKIVDCWI